MYQLVRIQGVVVSVLREDGAQIPNNANNGDWQAFIQWNSEQDTPLSLIATEPSLAEQRAAKQMELDSWWETQRLAGVTPEGQAFALGIDANDVALLNGTFTQAQVAVQLGLRSTEDTFPIITKSGEAIFLTLSQMTTVLLSYGAQRAALSVAYSARKSAIETAESEDTLQAIEIG